MNDVWQSGRLNVTYIEKGNLICNSNRIQFDENGNYVEVYYWNGENEHAEW